MGDSNLSLRRYEPYQVRGSGRLFAQSQPEASDTPKKDLYAVVFSIIAQKAFVKRESA